MQTAYSVEDFLSKFDFLIDYDRHWLQFGGAVPAGERYRFETIGQHHGSPTTNQLLIAVRFAEVSDSKFQLELDSGAKMLELFPVREDSPSSELSEGSMATSGGNNEKTIYSHIPLKIGAKKIHGVDVVQSRSALAFDAAGLLPASLFQKIYITHSGGFVVLDWPLD